MSGKRMSERPTSFFIDGLLSVPGYTFEQANPWDDAGTFIQLAEGVSMKDESNVLAKITPSDSKSKSVLEREFYILKRIATSSEALRTTLRIIDFFIVPKMNGHCVVLLLSHPGVNTLGRYLPTWKVNGLLLTNNAQRRPPSPQDNGYKVFKVDAGPEEDASSRSHEVRVMDLTTFLEFAVQATHCLEQIHKLGITHNEVRANAFHSSLHSGLLRLVHFGNRSEGLEQVGGISALISKTGAVEKINWKEREALCHLAPEQTDAYNGITQTDHRTDLYSLGVLFWTLIAGRGAMPFDGSPLEILHAVVQNKPIAVRDVRKDIPEILSSIIAKLLEKHPDDRYQSAYGLKQDLYCCQNRFQHSVMADSSLFELIPAFEIAKQEKYTSFIIPAKLFGREDELNKISNVIRQFYPQFQTPKKSSTQHFETQEMKFIGSSPSMSSRSASPDRSWDAMDQSPKSTSAVTSFYASNASQPLNSDTRKVEGLRRGVLAFRAAALIVVGPSGAGKSSLILANKVQWRSQGLWGQAKFQQNESAPFICLLACLSTVLRQLMVSDADVRRFSVDLKDSLGVQLQNISLLYEGAPQLRDILEQFGTTVEHRQEPLTTAELRDRFISLVQKVFSVLAQIRPFALFLDDLHDASPSSLDLIEKLITLKTRLFIFATIRSDLKDREGVRRVYNMFRSTAGGLLTNWITLTPLSQPAISSLVSQSLRCSPEDCVPLSRYVYESCSGNAFSARRLLNDFYRQHLISFDMDHNVYRCDISAIESRPSHSDKTGSVDDLSFLHSIFHQLPSEAKECLTLCAFLGSPSKTTEMKILMEWTDYSGSDSEDEGASLVSAIEEALNSSANKSHLPNQLMRGLQIAVSEGWLVDHTQETCWFAHDRYRNVVEAEIGTMSKDIFEKIHLKIILMLLNESKPDAYRIAKHSKCSLSLLRGHPDQERILKILNAAGVSAWARGAHELALHTFTTARSLLPADSWISHSEWTFNLLSKIAELSTWNSDFELSDDIIQECLQNVVLPEHRAKVLRMRSTNYWMRNDHFAALKTTLSALSLLGIHINEAPSRREADILFEEVSSEILIMGWEAILAIPRASDPKTDLAVALLNDAGTNAYWSSGEGFSNIIGLTTIQLALSNGMSPGTAVGFFWALEAAAERRDMYRFSADLGRLALKIAGIHGGSMEKCRVLLLYSAMVSGYDSVHIRENLPRLEEALKHGDSAGDRVYTMFSALTIIEARLFLCNHLSDLVIATEDCLQEAQLRAPSGDSVILVQGLLNCIRAMGGHTYSHSAETAFDAEDFDESEYFSLIKSSAGSKRICLNWYNAFKVVGYFCMGYADMAAKLGFSIYETRETHPNHRHVRYALFFHSLALIACVRQECASVLLRNSYMAQIDLNQTYLRKWLSPSPINSSVWVTLVDAELASLHNLPDALRLYDVAVKVATNNEWLLEEGWALYLVQGCHLIRQSVEGLGAELQRKGASLQAHWGAHAIANYMTGQMSDGSMRPPRRLLLTSDMSVQTEEQFERSKEQSVRSNSSDSQELSDLSASDLANILKWSSAISRDINLSSALERLTEIASESSESHKTCVIIAREAGHFTLATTMIQHNPCQTHEDPRPIETVNDALQRVVLKIVLSSTEPFHSDNVYTDPRITADISKSTHQSVLCLPIFSNRGQTFGAVYFANHYAFDRRIVTMQTLLCRQAGISISNALLFHSVQSATKDHMKVIQSQKNLLEDARRSKEEALQASKTKTNFLAAMSHELRTPFSSFYGHMELLSETQMNTVQADLVTTSRDSCELLLGVIDSILDYSKLEAAGVTLSVCDFPIESVIADCVELLLPNAATKLDLSFHIEACIPPWVIADKGRIHQIIMNLVGNAVKFTASGFVTVVCSTDSASQLGKGDALLKFDIQDTGIGLSSDDIASIFMPFQQVDSSSTRRYGGTGLGLAISTQLVKLMGGTIGVRSKLGVGSTFWFTVPVKISNSSDCQKNLDSIGRFRIALRDPYPLRLLLCSSSPATIHWLTSILDGLETIPCTCIEDAESYLRRENLLHKHFDFILLDSQSEDYADRLIALIQSLHSTVNLQTTVVHFHTFTKGSIGGRNVAVVKMRKPPRTVGLLERLVEISGRPLPSTPYSGELPNIGSPRVLYGNVLVAEDNEVSRNMLVRQLKKFGLEATPTCDGNEAIRAWQSHEPGYFSLALFDHHMPFCDGVEATKRLRILESQVNAQTILPIVALSADCQEPTKKLCLSAGMNAFFSKPLKSKDMTNLLSMFGMQSN